MHVKYIDQVYKDHSSHFTPTLRQLQQEAAEFTVPDTQPGRRRKNSIILAFIPTKRKWMRKQLSFFFDVWGR